MRRTTEASGAECSRPHGARHLVVSGWRGPVVLLVAMVLLAACGGSESSPDATPEPPPGVGEPAGDPRPAPDDPAPEPAPTPDPPPAPDPEPDPEPPPLPPPEPVPVPEPPVGGDAQLRTAQAHLADLGVPVGPLDGIDGPQTRRGLCVWRRLTEVPVHRGPLEAGELERIVATRTLPAAGPGTGLLVDRTCQSVSLRTDGGWREVFAASTGAGGLPRPGSYVIQRTRAGWHTSTLYPAAEPNMYNALYFAGAIAVHGSRVVPTYPASAGCVRVTPAAADVLFASLGVGDPVEVVGTW